MIKFKVIFFSLLYINIYSTCIDDLSLDQKIGQLLMVAVPTDCKDSILNIALQSLSKNNIGSIIFLGQGSVERQLELTNKFQNLARVKFLIAKDFEPGFFRLTDIVESPKNRTLGSVNEELVLSLGGHIGKLCKLIGVHINFAPVVDVSCNPKNPVIRARSFGQDKNNVVKKGVAFMKGVQGEGIIACAKHFPGHGDTQVDSHVGLPIINHKIDRLKKIEMVPFKELIKGGVNAVMTAHIKVLSLDKKNPASLSEKTIDLLRKDLKFDGLIVSDALNMKALSFDQSESAVHALKAGNDIVILARPKAGFIDSADQDDYLELYEKIVPETVRKIREAVLSGELSEDEINKKVERVLSIKNKYSYKVNDFKEVRKELLEWNKKMEELKREIFQNSLVKKGRFIFGKKILNVQAFDIKEPLIKNVDIINLSDFLLKDLKNYDQVVLEIFNVDVFKKNYGLTDSDLLKIKELESRGNITLVIYGLPYILDLFNKKTPSIIAHENDLYARQAVNQFFYHHFCI
jgi:beta-N-acetylhexosaminidase